MRVPKYLKLVIYTVVCVIVISMGTDIECQLLDMDYFDTKIMNFLIFILVFLIYLMISKDDDREKEE